MLPLREVANGDMSVIRVHALFPMSNISRIQSKLGSFSQDPTTFIKEFQALTSAFDLTWQDIHIILTACCTHEEKARIWALAKCEQMRGMLETPVKIQQGQTQSQEQILDIDTRQMIRGQQGGELGGTT